MRGVVVDDKRQAIIFMGLQASGKSSYYAEHFADTHVRINLDMLNTRNRERHFLRACLDTTMAFVVDNTNLTKEDRQRYIPDAKAKGYKVIGYYFNTPLDWCLKMNAYRMRSVPEKAIMACSRKLELPCRSEGFDELWEVKGGHATKWEEALVG